MDSISVITKKLSSNFNGFTNFVLISVIANPISWLIKSEYLIFSSSNADNLALSKKHKNFGWCTIPCMSQSSNSTFDL